MIGKTIRRGGLHYEILEQIGEGGPVHRPVLRSFSEGESLYIFLFFGEIL